MMKILCNFPLESFEERQWFRDVDLLTYGRATGKTIGKQVYDFDLVFDPSTGSITELLSALPAGWLPDLLLIYYPGQEPLPRGLEASPVPVVAVISDWNLHFEQLWGLAPFFDLVLADRLGTRIFRAAGCKETAYWPQYTFRRHIHYPRPELTRDIDVSFVGNMNPEVQGERMIWLHRLEGLADRCRVELLTGVFDDDYGRLLSRSRIGFNRSIRGEINLRAFEICAAQALLFMERENGEVREFLVPDQEVVLYDDTDLETKILWFLENEPERARIAAAGYQKIQDYSLSRNLDRLGATMAGIRAGGRPEVEPWRLHLGRALGMSRTWATGETVLAEVVKAAQLNPGHPEIHNTIGVTMALHWPQKTTSQVFQEIGGVTNMAPDYVPAAYNLAQLYQYTDQPEPARKWFGRTAELAEQATSFDNLRGLLLPLRFTAKENEIRTASAMALLADDPHYLGTRIAGLARENMAALAGTLCETGQDS